MQVSNLRSIVLALLLLGGAGLYASFGTQPRVTAPRWPGVDSVFAVDQWSMGPLDVVHSSHDTDVVTRVFRSGAGQTATLTLVANKLPKLYGPGAEVPVLGSGYQVEAAPGELVGSQADGIGGLIAARNSERWLFMYTYGERRGLLGNGLEAWSLAIADGIVGAPNDYYKMYLMARADDAEAGRALVALARTLFPQVAAWYAA